MLMLNYASCDLQQFAPKKSTCSSHAHCLHSANRVQFICYMTIQSNTLRKICINFERQSLQRKIENYFDILVLSYALQMLIHNFLIYFIISVFYMVLIHRNPNYSFSAPSELASILRIIISQKHISEFSELRFFMVKVKLSQ